MFTSRTQSVASCGALIPILQTDSASEAYPHFIHRELEALDAASRRTPDYVDITI